MYMCIVCMYVFMNVCIQTRVNELSWLCVKFVFLRALSYGQFFVAVELKLILYVCYLYGRLGLTCLEVFHFVNFFHKLCL